MPRKPAKLTRRRGEGSIYTRNDGRVVGALVIGRLNGKPDRRTVYGWTAAEVEGKLAALRAQRDAGRAIPTKVMRCADLLSLWMETVARPRIRPNTAQSYEDYLSTHLLPQWGHRRVDSLTPPEIQAWYAAKLRAGYAAATVRHMHSLLRAALQLAVDWELLDRNPCARVKPPPRARPETHALDWEGATRLWRALLTDSLGAAWLLALVGGLRRSELLGLKWPDWDRRRNLLRIRRGLHEIRGQGRQALPTKSRAGERVLPLDPIVVQVLERHEAHVQALRAQADGFWQEDGYIFPNAKGGPLSPSYYWRRWKGFREAQGLGGLKTHELRHSFASLLADMGTNVMVIAALMGHSDPRITMGVYGHVIGQGEQEAITALVARLVPPEVGAPPIEDR